MEDRKATPLPKSACSTNILDFQTLPIQQTAIESCQLVEYPCYTSLPRSDDTPLEFRIDGTDAFIDLNRSYLQLKLQLKKADGGAVSSQTMVAPINNIFYSMFQGVDILINDRKLTEPNDLYTWESYLYSLLYTSNNDKKTILQSGAGWSTDEAGAFDEITDVTATDQIVNAGFEYRRALFADDKTVMLQSKIFTNVRFDRLIPPHTEVTFRFNRATAPLITMAKEGAFVLKVMDAKLLVTRVRLSDKASFESLLSSKGYIYPSTVVSTKTKTISKGDQNFDWVPFEGKLPSRVYIWQVSQNTFNGSIKTNPFNFKTFGMTRLQVLKNGVSLPNSQGFVNMAGSGSYIPAYLSTLAAIASPETASITYFDYTFGNFVLVVDLTDDASLNCGYDNPSNHGTLRLSVDYENALTEPITLFCMAEFQSTFKIDRDRNVQWIE